MKVLALTEGPDHVCYRYRIEAFTGALARRGGTLAALPLAPHTWPRNNQLRQAAGADVVVLQRKLLPLWQLRILRRAARRLVYDFDDALFCRDSYSLKGPQSWTRMAHFWATVYSADCVIAGNRFLWEQAGELIDPRRVRLIPTSIDPGRYPMSRHLGVGVEAKLVWIGQSSTLPCLDRAERLLAAAAQRLPGLRMRVICDRFPDLQGVAIEQCHWSEATEAADLAAADIGVSWLPDDTWSQGKCGLKVLQYMAAGLPVVANAVGMNREMVRHGHNGLLATTPGQWADAVSRLSRDPDLRRRMGAAGRELVEQRFHIEYWGERFATLIDDVHRGHSSRAAPGMSGEEFAASGAS